MAKRNYHSSPKKKPQSAKRPLRASQRIVLGIDLAEQSLRHLMIEQCKKGPDYVTAYRGSRAALAAAGIPAEAFPIEGAVAEFQVQTLNACCTGSQELLDGAMRSTAEGFELEIDWKHVRPYMQCSHPAVGELARMLLKDVLAWADNPDLAHPINMLVADSRSVYKPRPGAPRLQVTHEFQQKLLSYASCLFEFVHTNCEVMPQKCASANRPRPGLRIVANNTDTLTR